LFFFLPYVAYCLIFCLWSNFSLFDKGNTYPYWNLAAAQGFRITLIVLSAYFLLIELIRIRSYNWSYFRTVFNYINLCALVLVL